MDWRDQDLVRLDIKINGEDAPPLSSVCHRSQAYARGKGGLPFPMRFIETSRKRYVRACIYICVKFLFQD